MNLISTHAKMDSVMSCGSSQERNLFVVVPTEILSISAYHRNSQILFKNSYIYPIYRKMARLLIVLLAAVVCVSAKSFKGRVFV